MIRVLVRFTPKSTSFKQRHLQRANYCEIADHTTEVLHALVFKETEVATKDQKWFFVRIMPYHTIEDPIDGLVITLIDITQAKKAEAKLATTLAILQENKLEAPWTNKT